MPWRRDEKCLSSGAKRRGWYIQGLQTWDQMMLTPKLIGTSARIYVVCRHLAIPFFDIDPSFAMETSQVC